jgi:D-xylose transport system substrate-binding protein
MTRDPRRRALRLGAVLLAGVLVAAGCGGDDDDDGGGASGDGDAIQIALLLPETKTTRYETQDRPMFEAKVEELCPECEIIYSNADQDESRQQQQAEAAIANGADVMVLDPVNGQAAGAIVEQAAGQDIPVISYDRLILDTEVDYYLSFQNEEVGRLQAEALVDRLAEDGADDGTIVMINGSPDDNNASQFKAGAHSVFDESGLTIGAEYDTPDWSPDEAQQEMDQAIAQLGEDGIDGVYAANDGTAGGAIAAMEAANFSELPPVTGQDAELAAIQRILAGDQFMTVYKAIKDEAETAAELAVALGRGEDPPEGLVNDEVDNGAGMVPSVLLTPVAVTRENIADTVVADEFWSVEDICTADFADACAEAGLE